MPTSITLLIAYPKEVIRAGLRAMLAKSTIRVVAEAENSAGTITLAKKHRPEVLLTRYLSQSHWPFGQVACLGNPDPADMKVYCPMVEETFDDDETTSGTRVELFITH